MERKLIRVHRGFLGRMLADRFLGRSVIVRELMPQDLKLEIDQLIA
jgi:hypothetical protein